MARGVDQCWKRQMTHGLPLLLFVIITIVIT